MAQKNWNIADMPDLSGKIMVVTGGNSGLGFEAVKALSAKGANVIMACRSTEKGNAARKAIIDLQPTADISVMEIDLMDLKSIHDFANQFKVKYSQLDVLLNNAGIMMVPYGLTIDGFEKQMGTNHLGHFALTGLLLDVLRQTPKSRVVNVSSLAHKNGLMDFNNLLFEHGLGYTPMKAYGRSKLSNLLFTYELQRFFQTNQIDCSSLAAHPGISDTNLFNQVYFNWLIKLLKPLFSWMIQPASMGVLPELCAATDPNAKGADYYGPDGKREMKGYPILVKSNPTSHNREYARELWEQSEKITSVKFV